MRWTGPAAILAVVGLMLVPTAYTFSQQPVLAGHTTYTSMDGLDPCIAGVVGVVRLRVMWFNDQVLFERAAGDGAAFIYALQSGAPDPRDKVLVPTGDSFEFDDPNGVAWKVTEYNFTGVTATWFPGTSVPPDPDARAVSYYAWVVQTGPTVNDDAATGRPYNFVDLVDTCKFTSPGADVHHARSGGNWTSDWGNDTTEDHHLASDPDHRHERFSVDLYVGEKPRTAEAAAVLEEAPSP